MFMKLNKIWSKNKLKRGVLQSDSASTRSVKYDLCGVIDSSCFLTFYPFLIASAMTGP